MGVIQRGYIAGQQQVSTNKATGVLPVRRIIVASDAPLGTKEFDDAVNVAAKAAKAKEQDELEGLIND
jgi:hypothetical protein